MLNKLIVILSLVVSYSGICGTTPFVTTWQTNNQGTSQVNQITIPTFPGEVYNYTVDWRDGNVTNETGDAIHTYATEGRYTIEITGIFPRIYFNNEGDALKLLSIDAWGDNVWSSMEGAFYGCENMQGAFTDAPDLSLVTSMANMFRQARIFNWPINNWRVDNVVDMSNLFNNFIEGETIIDTVTPVAGTAFSNIVREVFFTGAFNQEVSSWNVTNVTNMSGMFSANPFNRDIGNWVVDNVTDMSFMFYLTIAFNQDITGWNVSQVSNMNYMFGDCRNFNQDISSWDVSSVISMRGMFSYANSFNQNLNTWSIDGLLDMGEMFSSASSFDQPLDNWEVGNVLFMDATFDNADSFNQDLSNWDVSNVTTMRTMFLGADLFDQNLDSWQVGNVTDFAGMFAFITEYNQPLGSWDMSNAVDISAMFGFAENFNQDISGWNVANVEQMRFTFFDAFEFEQDLGAWNVSSLLTAENMFTGVVLSVTNYDSLLIGWESNIINSDVPFDGGDSKYCAGEEARNRMVNINNWEIIDGGPISFSINNVTAQTMEYSFVFPEIKGVNLTGNEAYYTEPNAQGTKYEEGEALIFSETENYPIDIYIYDETMAKFPCAIEESFELTLTQCGTSVTPLIDDFIPASANHSYTFSNITGGNLTGDQAYYTESGGQGTQFLPSDVIYFKDYSNFPITIYIYDERISSNGYTCVSEKEFELTITETLPLCTELITPFNNETDVSVDTTLIEWESVFNADGYLLSVFSVLGTQIITNADTTDAFYEFNEELAAAEEFIVTIEPYNSIGSALGCSEQRFKTETNIQFPKFFTPNNDGKNDEWTVPNPFNSFDKAFIFDRYGRLLNQILDPDNNGWDGTFNGESMPSSDYWYKVMYSSGQIFTGSFTLIR